MFDLSPRIIETVSSQYSGDIKVVQSWGYKYIATGPLTQSGGLVKDVWEPVLNKLSDSRGKTWLILGLAAGTIADLVSRRLSPQKITGVEIDPVMIYLGKKYFDLDKIPYLEIVTADAQKYLPAAGRFDYVLVDVYLGDKLPAFVYSRKFVADLKKALVPGGKVVINHLFYDAAKRGLAQKLIDLLTPRFSEVKLKRVLTNLLIICS
jgi:spermidine synthase